MAVPPRTSFPRRALQFAALLAVLLVVIVTAERLVVAQLESQRAEAARADADAEAADLRARFVAFQEETRASVDAVRARVAAARPLDEARAFALLAEEERPGIALEWRGPRREIVAWNGNRGPAIDTVHLRGAPTSFVLQGPITSTLVVALPADSGLLIGKRLFDVSFPISNRFLNSAAFSKTFTAQLPYVPEFRFPATTAPVESGRVAVTLDGIDGRPLGVAILTPPPLAARIDRLHRTTLGWLGGVALALLAVVALFLLPPALGRAPAPLRAGAWVAFIWVCRLTCLFLDIPNAIVSSRLFDPVTFASSFGFGLARSLGDLVLSATAVLLTTIVLARPFLGPSPARTPRGGRWALAALLPAALAFAVALRSLLAAARSGVVDSSLSFSDPATLFPGTELGLMLLSLLMLAVAFVLAGAALLSLARRCVGAAFPGIGAGAAWSVAAAAFLLVGAVVGLLSPHPLIAAVPRSLVTIGLALLGAWLARRREGTGLRAAHAVVVAFAAVLLLVPALDAAVHDLDREHVELMAREIVRPVDGWLSFVMGRALDDVSGGETARILRDGDPDDIEKVAFTAWAKSILSKEGNDCSVTFVDAEGSVVSDFHIGVGQQWFRRHPMDEMPRSTRLVESDERAVAGNFVKWYRGYAPVYAADSTFLGGVWVELSGANERFVRGEGEEILRNSSREDFATHHRKLFFFEYFDGELVSSTSEEAPLHSRLPDAAAAAGDSSDGVWMDATIGGLACELFYLPDHTRAKGGSGIGLGMEALDLRWHLFAFLRYASFFFLVVLAAVGALIALRLGRGRPAPADFRVKLLAAFLVVSLIPLAVVGYSNRLAATERTTEATEKDLSRQTQAVAAALERTFGVGTPALVARITDEQCEDLAGTLDIDFNVYRGATLQASSKPEMFTAELLDHALSAPAYRRIVLEHRSFFAERQTIGALPYIVGYRPLLAENGRVVGVVSVPTLFSRNEVESELSARNALLSGAYAFALILAVGAGTLFANQISSPVRRLSAATAQLAAGNMEIGLRRSSSDELGDLEESFTAMAARLKRSQEQMLKAQKELAWREMAKQVAHEIKNPLTPMKLSLQHLRQAYRDGTADFGELLGRVTTTVLEQIETLSRIASEFSNVARMPQRAPLPVDVHEILREALNLYEAGTVRISAEFGAARSVVEADREELRRAFINVLRNSVQAMGGKGAVRITSASDAGTITIGLRDTGPGIPPEVLARLFEPNFSTKTDGMGLGLTLVRSTIEGIGGTIAVASGPGEGTLVTIILPLATTP